MNDLLIAQLSRTSFSAGLVAVFHRRDSSGFDAMSFMYLFSTYIAFFGIQYSSPITMIVEMCSRAAPAAGQPTPENIDVDYRPQHWKIDR